LISVAFSLVAGLLGLYLYLRRIHFGVIPDLIQAPHFLGEVPPHPLWGSLVPNEEVVSQVHKNYVKNPEAKVVRFHALFVPTVLVFDPKLVRRVLATENYPKSVIYNSLRAFLGDGLICNAGTK